MIFENVHMFQDNTSLHQYKVKETVILAAPFFYINNPFLTLTPKIV